MTVGVIQGTWCGGGRCVTVDACDSGDMVCQWRWAVCDCGCDSGDLVWRWVVCDCGCNSGDMVWRWAGCVTGWV